MGGAVSSGRDNDELIDNLMGGNHIRTRTVERVFRAIDRADYMTPEARDQAYKDAAWRNGPLHMSAPCIYSEVMEGLELKPGLSFLNVGSGTGYVSTMVGLIIGSSGISHGIEIHPMVVEYANKKLSQFMENSAALDEFDFCEPKFYCGNGMCLAPLQTPYDRVYCGAGCPEEYQNYFKQLIKVGGILVMPLNDNLVQVKRTGATEWTSRYLLNVTFAPLRPSAAGETLEPIKLDELCPARLQVLARASIRASMRAAMMRRHPELRDPPPRAPPPAKSRPRQICIPLEEDSDDAHNALHDLDAASGGHEMNALLSLVLSMGHNRVAGALRVDSLRDDSMSEDDSSSERRSEGGSERRSGADEGNDRDEAGAQEPRDDDDGDDDDDDDNGNDRRDQRRNRLEVVLTDAERRNRSRDQNSDTEGEEDAARRRAARDIILFEFSNQRRRARPRKTTNTATVAPQNDEASPSTSPPDETTKSRGCKGDGESTTGRGKRTTVGQLELYLGEPEATSSFLNLVATERTQSRKKSLSEEDTTTSSTSKARDEKRQKLDSGLGEENTPSSSTTDSPQSTHSTCSPAKSDDTDGASRRSSSLTDDEPRGRRRRQKRGHGQVSHSSSLSSASSSDDEDSKRHRRASRSRSRNGSSNSCNGSTNSRNSRNSRNSSGLSESRRRVRLSLAMKRGVKELPLPQQLKKYVNLGRCFEF